MSRNRKLRLFVIENCSHHCPLCCNKTWDIEYLQRVNRWNYQEIMITGGEPLLHPLKVIELVNSIRTITNLQGTNPAIYLYTSVCDNRLDKVASYLTGIVVTPHTEKEVHDLLITNERFLQCEALSVNYNISLRLNLFDNMKKLIPSDTDLSLWQVKRTEWIKDCPIPVGEDFRRINNLW